MTDSLVRKRAGTAALVLARSLLRRRYDVVLVHRDLARPVVERPRQEQP
ncbi:hypothetical protein ACWIG4_29855 [Streptomyces sp. NPDC002248]